MISLRSKFHLPVSRTQLLSSDQKIKKNIYMADVFSVLNDVTPTKAECFIRVYYH